MTKYSILMVFLLLLCQFSRANSDSFPFKSFWQEFDQAQVEFIDGSLQKAKHKFSIVASKYAKQSNLPSKERRLIHYALLRIAQLAESKTIQEKSIYTAIEFAPDLLPDRKIFPPPFYRSYVLLRSSSKHFKKSALKLVPKKALQFQDSQSVKKSRSKYDRSKKSRWLWVGLTGLSLFAGYRIYKHNQPEKLRDKLVVPTSEISRF